jgi:hypothetical protein
MSKTWKKYVVAGFAMLSLGFATSCGNNSTSNIQIAGMTGPTVTLMTDNVLISMVFLNMQMDGGLRYNIPKYVNSYLEVSPDLQSNGTLMSVSVSLKDIFNGGLDKLDPQSLPGGRNLPGVSSGTLPAVAFSIPQFHNMSFYLGQSLFGIFIPAKVGVDGAIASFRYYIAQKAAGTISLVGNDAKGENSGVLLMLNMTGQVQAQLKSVYKKYNP